MIMNDWYVM